MLVRSYGNCGYWEIASLLYMDEESWAKIRHDLIHELQQDQFDYTQPFVTKDRSINLLFGG